MTGPNPPGRETEESDSASELSGGESDSGGDPGDEPDADDEVREISPYDALDPLDDSAEIARAGPQRPAGWLFAGLFGPGVRALQQRPLYAV